MKNPFLELDEEEHKAPPVIKKEVDGSMGFLRFMSEIVELYLGKSGKVLSGFMTTFEGKD